MRVSFFSDLHLEFDDTLDVDVAQADVVILAGDIHRRERAVPWIVRSLPDALVLYVIGNHEHYGSNIDRTVSKIRAAAEKAGLSRLHVLDCSTFEHGGWAFLGATLWTDWNLNGSPQVAMREAEESMNDFRKIRIGPDFRRLRPADVGAIHARDRSFIEAELSRAKERGLRTCVITHHPPSRRCLPREFVEACDPLNPAYCSNLDEMIVRTAPDVWLCGHVHSTVRLRIGRCAVLSNPRGYHGHESNPLFSRSLVLDLDAPTLSEAWGPEPGPEA